MNDHLVLIAGKSASGKSASLMNLANPEGVLYLNCENNKKLPFKSKFNEKTVTDPMQVYEAFDWVESKADIHTVVIDSLTYLMDMYESKYVLTASNTMKAWGQYAQFFKVLMSDKVANSTKNVIFIAHTSDVFNESEMVSETMVKIKGSVMNQGVESYFTTVIAAKKVPLAKLVEVESDLLQITPDDEALGYKHCFQTRLTKDTVNERIRSSIGLWGQKEAFIDNDVQKVIDRLHEYYD